MQRRETRADAEYVMRLRFMPDLSCDRGESATVLAPTLEFPKLREPSAEGTLDRPERRIELRSDLAQAEPLEVRPLDDGPLQFG